MSAYNTGFINHACLAFTCDASKYTGIDYNKNRLERLGEGMLWHVTHLPSHIAHFFCNPKVATVALTALAMFTVQFTFYPSMTYFWVKDAVVFLSHYIEPWAVKFAFYLATQTGVLGAGIRALGRFSNTPLLNSWYNQELPKGASAHSLRTV